MAIAASVAWERQQFLDVFRRCIGNSQWCLYNTQSKSDRLLNQEYCKLIGSYWKMMRRQLWTFICPFHNTIFECAQDIHRFLGLTRTNTLMSDTKLSEHLDSHNIILPLQDHRWKFTCQSSTLLTLCLGICWCETSGNSIPNKPKFQYMLYEGLPTLEIRENFYSILITLLLCWWTS